MKKKLMINREISWLSFNERVLQEAADERVPLIERMRFLGIFSNNLDEFFRIRVATWRRLLDLPDTDNALKESPAELLNQINKIDYSYQQRFLEIYDHILRELEKENIFILNENQLTDDQGVFLREFFRENVRPNLFPIMMKNIKRSTSLRDKSIYLAVRLRKKDKSLKDNHALIKVPTTIISRFLILPKKEDRNFIMLLDDVIRYNLADIFSVFDYDEFDAYTIKITRDAELEIDNDVSKSLMERMSDSIKQRKKGRPVRFVYDKDIPDPVLKMVMEKLKISGKDNTMKGGRYHNFKDFIGFPNVGGPHLEYSPAPQLPHRHLSGNKSILAAVRERDIMINFPYQSFQYIIDLLREASIDPAVKSIKMTLYRVARTSKVINALVNAARNGKDVTVYLELQARFDEQANIYWSEKMQEEGVNIIHGVAGFKVHSKLILIKRKEGGLNRLYANIGTGNFNETTSKIYGDVHLLTANPAITEEVDQVFGLFERSYLAPVVFRHLIVSPFKTRRFIIQMINQEIVNARAGKKAEVIMKLNSLVDATLVKKIYAASAAGVKFRLIIRGICVLVPGVKGLSENIEAISIVDRYLEHARIFVFHNNGNRQYFITSADLMARNLDHRIEVGVPVWDEELKKELQTILDLQWKDNVKARLLGKNDLNQYRINDEAPFRSQLETYNYFKNQFYQH
ncbi:MAG: polyphosphate kinase 1 [Bacteroidales bacterium]|nr:polyphosphate kinase 1 [Bacteroidales bacterium]